MKFAFTTFSCPNATWPQVVALAKQHGYAGIEPRAQQKHAHEIEVIATADERRDIKHRAEDANIAICCLATSCRFVNPAESRVQINTAKALIELAADIGCPIIRVFAGNYSENLGQAAAL